jgi:hypothetical protein
MQKKLLCVSNKSGVETKLREKKKSTEYSGM